MHIIYKFVEDTKSSSLSDLFLNNNQKWKSISSKTRFNDFLNF